MAQRTAERLPSIRRVILFGSLAAGIPTPHSDADLLVELSESPFRRPQDRVPEVLRAMSPLPCPVDLFVYTSTELGSLQESGSPLVRAALQHGQDLL
jgi:predicted nucleotidyltransferase